jgi:transposase
MMGIKERNFQPLPEDISLEDLVPEDNFYRRLQERLDLSFVRELVEDLYAPSGRPSIDPEVFFRLQMVMFHEGIRSERELMRIFCDRLSARWYVGYDLFEALPDHSSLTRIRDRYGLSVFREFFERVVELYIEAELVWGEELYFDATRWTPTPPWSRSPRGSMWRSIWENSSSRKPPLAHNKGRALSWLTTVVSRMWPIRLGRAWLRERGFICQDNGLHPIAQAELRKDISHLGPDHRLSYAELICDLFVG